MLKISVEHRSALSMQRNTVEITIDDRGRGRVASWEGSALLARAGAASQNERQLAAAEVADVWKSIQDVQLRLAPLPDHSGMYDGWTTTLGIQDAYTTFSLRWFCAAPPSWRGVEDLAEAVQAAADGRFAWPCAATALEA